MSAVYFVHPSSECEPGARIGRGSKIWRYCHVMAGARLGEDCSLGQGCFVADGAVVGNRVRIQNHVSIYSGVVLEDDVFCGPGVVFTNIDRPRSAINRHAEFKRTFVRRGATLGANSTLCPGVTVGCHALVGAGAVVRRDVLPYAEVVGVPARQRGWVSLAGERLDFDTDGEACCPRGGERYRLRSEAGIPQVALVREETDAVLPRAAKPLIGGTP